MMRGYPIVDVKISMPPPTRWVPERADALASLDRGWRTGVTVVASGPGYLGDELVAKWVRLHPQRPVAWLSLDPDDDAVRFVAHVIAAIQVVVPDFDPRIAVDDPSEPGSWQASAVDSVLEALGDLTEPLVLVFDGVHRPTGHSVRRGIDTLIRYRPPHVRIVILTGDDAAIDLAGARMAGAVVEVREPHLVLDVDQVSAMLAEYGLRPTAEESSSLHQATGGWPAGVALAATRADADGRFAPFAPHEEPVRSYLRSRILETMDEREATFFLQAASLGSVDIGMVAEVTGREDAGRALDRLCELHLSFAAPGPRPGWRSFPAHLQRFAHHELRGRADGEARALYRRAATWCLEHELFDESLRIAEYGDDMELVGTILLGHHLPWSAGGRADRVRAWCAALLQAEPGMLETHLAAAWASLFLGDDAGAASTLALLDARPVDGDRRILIEGELAVIRSHLARRRGDMRSSLDFVHEGEAAATRLGPDFSTAYAGALPGGIAVQVGVASLWAGELPVAIARLEEARSGWRWASQALVVVHSYLAIAHWLLDEDAARAHADVALNHVGAESQGDGDFTALCVGLILGVDGMAEGSLSRVQAMRAAVDEPVGLILAAVAEAVHVAETSPSAARAAVRHARRVADSCPEPGVLQMLVAKVAFHLGADGEPVLGDALTDGEQRVLRMLGGSLTEREIATELHLSHNTVRTYRRRLYRKLGLTSRSDVSDAISSMGVIGEL